MAGTTTTEAIREGHQYETPAQGAHTPGKWNWWTSCSWRRLRSDIGLGRTADVLMPTVHRDGQADIIVSEADMSLIAAAPDLKAFADSIQIYEIEGDNRLWLRVGNNPACSFNKHGLIAVSLLHLEAARRAAIAKAEGR